MGAWIETLMALLEDWSYLVAPRVGAWIETSSVKFSKYFGYSSHPVWVRGLKHAYIWEGKSAQLESHPVWVRGLKHNISIPLSAIT